MRLVPSDWAISHLFPGYFCQGEVAGVFMVGHRIFQLSISCRVDVTFEINRALAGLELPVEQTDCECVTI